MIAVISNNACLATCDECSRTHLVRGTRFPQSAATILRALGWRTRRTWVSETRTYREECVCSFCRGAWAAVGVLVLDPVKQVASALVRLVKVAPKKKASKTETVIEGKAA